MFYWMKQAKYECSIEQQFQDDAKDDIDRNASCIEEVHGIPGDIKANDWFDDGRANGDASFDVVIGNIFAASYIKQTSKKQLFLAKRHESMKRKKYHNHPNVIPLAIEVTGGMEPMFNEVIQQIANRISQRKNIPYSIMVNRVRTDIVAHLYKANVRMIMLSIGEL